MMDCAHWGSTRLARQLAIALAAAAVLPGVATAASTASLDAATNTVTVVGGPENNNVTTGGGLFGTMITDSAEIVAGPGCVASSDTQVSCGRYATINADLGAGDDTIGTSLGPGTMGVVHGGPGNDRIYGDSGNNRLYGDDGNDAIYGSSGDDYVDGGPGHDQLFGDDAYLEPGSDGGDTINARDGVQDDVACGYGWDQVTADAADTVGSECEQVSRSTPPPTGMSLKLSAPNAKIGAVLANGYAYRCWFSTAGTVGTSIWLSKDQARRLRLGGREIRLSSLGSKVDGGWYRIRLHVTKARYRSALRRAQSVTLTVVVNAIDSAGKRLATASKTVRLVR